MARYDAAGALLWDARLGGDGDQTGAAATLVGDSGFAVLGREDGDNGNALAVFGLDADQAMCLGD